MTVTAPTTETAPRPSEELLREIVQALAWIDRTPCSPGEREAAEWIAQRLRSAGAGEVAIEDEPSWGTFPPLLAGLGGLATAGAALVLSGRRAAGALATAAAVGGIVEEAQNGPRVLRRIARKRRTTQNVVARVGDPSAANTLVILAHHDAAQTGALFDQSAQQAIHKVFPTLLRHFKTPPPQWWLGLAGPLMTIAGGLSGRRQLARGGFVLSALTTWLMVDLWRHDTVPGANDNLSAVANLVAFAEALRERPLSGLRVLLVSCGAEETLQDGIRAFIARHDGELVQGRTWFLNPDTVGSPHLVMLEGEGPIWMEDYAGPEFRDLVAEVAEQQGIALERGTRARSSTDSVIPSRAGHPIAGFASLTDWRSLANYHLPSDTPENVSYDTVADVAQLSFAVAERLAARG